MSVDGEMVGAPTNVVPQDLAGLPPVYVDVPDKTGLPGGGTTKLLNVGLTEEEAAVAAEPAPALHPTTAEKRLSNVLGVTWILLCITGGVLYGVSRDAAGGSGPGQAAWASTVLAILVPSALVLTFYPHWKGRRDKKEYRTRHKAWVARFIENWPLRERLIDVDTIPDVWQRVSTRTMADTLAQDREAVLARGTGPLRENAAAVLAAALAAVGAWACAPSSDPALYRLAERAVDRFGELAGRRRAEDEPPAPPSNFT